MEDVERQPTREEGLRLLRDQEIDAAIECLTRVVESDPADARAYSYLGAAYARKGEFTESIRAFEQSLAINPTPSAYFNLGLAYQEAGRLTAAVSHYHKALELEPHYTPASEAIERLISTEEGGPAADEVASLPEVETEPSDEAQQNDLMENVEEVQEPAVERALVRSQHRAMMRSGLILGAAIGAVWGPAIYLLLSVFVFRYADVIMLATSRKMPVAAALGAILGGLTGLLSGFTGGAQSTGIRFGLLFGLLGGAGMAVAGGSGGTETGLAAVVGAALGGVGGYLIGLISDALTPFGSES
ncbi:MAG: tetratricopeptide repeat protein [Armatimonadetes bacterium]|nr:tetratricopeptide repeat protein [Armatimonadota bacterium]